MSSSLFPTNLLRCAPLSAPVLKMGKSNSRYLCFYYSHLHSRSLKGPDSAKTFPSMKWEALRCRLAPLSLTYELMNYVGFTGMLSTQQAKQYCLSSTVMTSGWRCETGLCLRIAVRYSLSFASLATECLTLPFHFLQGTSWTERKGIYRANLGERKNPATCMYFKERVLNGERQCLSTLLDLVLRDPAVPWLRECKACCEPCSAPMGVKEQLEHQKLSACGRLDNWGWTEIQTLYIDRQCLLLVLPALSKLFFSFSVIFPKGRNLTKYNVRKKHSIYEKESWLLAEAK